MSQTQDKRTWLKNPKGESIAYTESDDHVFTPYVELTKDGERVEHETPISVRALELEDVLGHILDQLVLMNRYFAQITDIEEPLELDNEPTKS